MVKRFRQFLLESFGEGVETFEDKIDKGDVIFENTPKNWDDVSVNSCDIKFTTRLDVKKYGVESINFDLNSLDISYTVKIDDEEERRTLRYSPSPDKVVVDKLSLFPYYAHDIVINMLEQEDEKNFMITISFGHE